MGLTAWPAGPGRSHRAGHTAMEASSTFSEPATEVSAHTLLGAHSAAHTHGGASLINTVFPIAQGRFPISFDIFLYFY